MMLVQLEPPLTRWAANASSPIVGGPCFLARPVSSGTLEITSGAWAVESIYEPLAPEGWTGFEFLNVLMGALPVYSLTGGLRCTMFLMWPGQAFWRLLMMASIRCSRISHTGGLEGGGAFFYYKRPRWPGNSSFLQCLPRQGGHVSNSLGGHTASLNTPYLS